MIIEIARGAARRGAAPRLLFHIEKSWATTGPTTGSRGGLSSTLEKVAKMHAESAKFTVI